MKKAFLFMALASGFAFPSLGEDTKTDGAFRPEVFGRYDKLSNLAGGGDELYRAQYRLPKSVYAPDWEGRLPEIQEWLEKDGVKLGPGSSVSFDERWRILEVVETLDQLTRVELFLARFGGDYLARVELEIIELPLLDRKSVV